VAPCGVVTRALAPHLRHRLPTRRGCSRRRGTLCRKLVNGHEGGANHLTMAVSNIIEAEPVITTTTEALKTIIVGVGCRRGAESAKIIRAVELAVAEAGATLEQVRLLASSRY